MDIHTGFFSYFKVLTQIFDEKRISFVDKNQIVRYLTVECFSILMRDDTVGVKNLILLIC